VIGLRFGFGLLLGRFGAVGWVDGRIAVDL
jgi:hypothetical protein